MERTARVLRPKLAESKVKQAAVQGYFSMTDGAPIPFGEWGRMSDHNPVIATLAS